MRKSLSLLIGIAVGAAAVAWAKEEEPAKLTKQEVIESFRRDLQATEADARNADFWDTRGACALAVGDYADAESSGSKARAVIDPSSPEAGVRPAEAELGRALALLRLARRDGPGAPLRPVRSSALQSRVPTPPPSRFSWSQASRSSPS